MTHSRKLYGCHLVAIFNNYIENMKRLHENNGHWGPVY